MGARASRAALGAVLVLLAGLAAVPVKLAMAPATVRVVGAGPSTAPPPVTTLVPVTTTVPAVAAPAAPAAPGRDDAPLQVVDGVDTAPLAPVDAAAAIDDVAPVAVVPATAAADPFATVAGGHVKAVVVGIDDYPGTASDLHGAVADATDMAAALARWGVPPQNVLLLEDANAAAGDIVGALDWLTAAAGPDDTAVVFYAGHARDLGFGVQAIMGSDGWLLTDHYLAEKLAPLRAHDAWIAMAACYGGGFDELLAPGRILTAAADAQSLAYESSAFGRSYLGQYLVRLGLLQGQAGGPTIQQAVAWAQAYLARDAPNRQLTELDRSTGPISIDGVRRTSVPPPAPLPPPAAPPAAAGSAPPSPPPPPPPPPASSPPVVCRRILGLVCAP